MGLWEMISLGVALGADSFSVSVGIGMNRVGWRRVVKLSLLFAFMQGILLLTGNGFAAFVDWLADKFAFTVQIGRCWEDLDIDSLCAEVYLIMSILGASVLAALGINQVRSYFTGCSGPPVFYRGRKGLLLLSLGVSMDALTAGVGLGMMEAIHLSWLVLLVTGTIWSMAFFGLVMGKRIARVVGRKGELIGGILLVVLAAHLLLEML